MGKRKKIEVKLSEEELTPSTIGYLDESKNGPFGLIALFLIFILFAVFLPEINEGVNKFLGKEQKIITPNESEKKEEEIPDSEEIKMYDLSDELTFEYNDIQFSNFKFSEKNGEDYLNISLTNIGDSIVYFDTSKYYIETYSNDKTLLERHIFNNGRLNLKSNLIQTIKLDEDEKEKISKITIIEKSEKDYPEYELKKSETGQYLLTCNSSSNKIEYTFDKDANITNIKDVVNYSNDKSDNYKYLLNKYQNQVANYNNKDGVSANLVEISTGFTVNTSITLSKVNINELSNDNYYESTTSPKVVKFEMEARGYSCN